MKINFSKEAMDKIMYLSRMKKVAPQVVVDNLLKNINLSEAESYKYEDNKKHSKKE